MDTYGAKLTDKLIQIPHERQASKEKEAHKKVKKVVAVHKINIFRYGTHFPRGEG